MSVRVDDGVVEGSDISMFYDPMIAKLVTHAPTREAAIDAQIGALDRFEIAGIGHNVDFLSALMQHPRFRSGAITTGFIAEEYPEGFHGAPASPELQRTLAAIAAVVDCVQAAVAGRITGQLDGHPSFSTARTVLLDGARHDVVVEGPAGAHRVTFGGGAAPLDVAGHWCPGQALFDARVAGEPLAVRIARRPAGWRLTARGATHDARVYPPRIAALARHMIEKAPPDLSRFLLCPMPGLLTALHVKAGDRVEAGQPLAVVEAMKMENVLRAEKSAVVATIHASPGDSLAVDAAILEFEGA